MSSWVRTGTVDLTNGSTTVTGNGTSWLSEVNVGWAFVGADSELYEITAVVSDTEIEIDNAYAGVTTTFAPYIVFPTLGLVRDLTTEVQALIADFQYAVVGFRNAKAFFNTQANMLADTNDYTFYQAGDLVWGAGIPYQVAPQGATDHDVISVSGVKFYSSFANSNAVGAPVQGPAGPGFTGGTYNSGDGTITFTSNDGIGFTTGDVRGEDAYQVWLDAGNTGTVNDFLDDLSQGAVALAQAAQVLAEAARDDAQTAETNAAASAATAAGHETTSGTNASNAATSAANASASEILAQRWAAEDEDVVVSTGLYSALHYAAKAAADAALTAADSSSTSGDVLLAQTYRDQAQAALTSVETIFDNFDDRFLGTKTSDPTVDNDGDPIVAGAVYYNSTADEVRFYNGATWDSPEAQAATSAAAALASQTAAASSEANAATSESNAAASQTAAAGHASDADADRIAADQHRIDAEAAETAAVAARVSSEAARDLAEDWAEQPEDVEVTTGKYSALHHAAKALTAQTAAEAAQAVSLVAQAAAETAETDAQTAQGLAEAARDAAQLAQTAAETARNQAQSAQSAAETAETNAAGHESAADADRIAAEAARVAAQAAQSAAETAQSASETARDLAQSWAAEAEDVVVSGGLYSALHYAAKAAADRALAQTAASDAANSETNANASAAAAASALSSIQAVSVGNFANDTAADSAAPTAPVGAFYFNTTTDTLRVKTSSGWDDAVLDAGGFLASANNLSEITNAATARTNLGLGSAALNNTGDFATAAQGTNADTAHGWGDHSAAGYLTSVAQGDVTQHQSALTINTAQIGDLPAFLTSVAFGDIDSGAVITSAEAFADSDVVLMTAAAIDDLILSKGYSVVGHTHVIADITDFTDNSTDWDTAFGWGDHSGVYLPIGGGTLTGNLELGTDGAVLTIQSSTAGREVTIYGDNNAELRHNVGGARLRSGTNQLLHIGGTEDSYVFTQGYDFDIRPGVGDATIDGVRILTTDDGATFIPNSEKGSANGVATLDGSGKVTLSQMPDGFDNYEEHADFASFPGTGVAATIYVALDTNYLYRWSGSQYNQVGGGGSGVNAVELTHTNGVIALDVSAGTHFRFDTDIYTGADPTVPILEFDTSFSSGTNNLPAGLQENDDVFLLIGNDNATTITIDEAGWNFVCQTRRNNRYMHVYHKRMGPEPDATFSTNSSTEDGFIAVYRGLKVNPATLTEPNPAVDWPAPDVTLGAGGHGSAFTFDTTTTKGASIRRNSLFLFEDVVFDATPKGIIIQTGPGDTNDYLFWMGCRDDNSNMEIGLQYENSAITNGNGIAEAINDTVFAGKTVDIYVAVQAHPHCELRVAMFEAGVLIFNEVYQADNTADAAYSTGWSENLTGANVGQGSAGYQPVQVLQSSGLIDNQHSGITLGGTKFWNQQVPWPEFYGVLNTPVANWKHEENYGTGTVYTPFSTGIAEPVSVDPAYLIFSQLGPSSDGVVPDFMTPDDDGDWDTENFVAGESTNAVIAFHSDGRITDGEYPTYSVRYNAPYIGGHYGTIGLELLTLQPSETGYRNFTINLSNLPDITEPATLELNVRDAGGGFVINGLTGWIGQVPQWNKVGKYSILLLPSDDGVYAVHLGSGEEKTERFQAQTLTHAAGAVQVDLGAANMFTFAADTYNAGTPEFIGANLASNFNHGDATPIGGARPGDILVHVHSSHFGSAPAPGADPNVDDGHPQNYPSWVRLDDGSEGTGIYVSAHLITADTITSGGQDLRGWTGNYPEQCTMLFRGAAWPVESFAYENAAPENPMQSEAVTKVTEGARAYQYFHMGAQSNDRWQNDSGMDDIAFANYDQVYLEKRDKGGFGSSRDVFSALFEERADSPTRDTGTTPSVSETTADNMSDATLSHRVSFALAPGASSGVLTYNITFANRPTGEYAHGYLFLELKDALQNFDFGGSEEWLNDNEPTFTIPGLYTIEYWVSDTQTRLLYHKTALGGLPYASEAQGTNADTAFGWGDHAAAGYQLEPTEGAFQDGDKTKLDGIQAGAEVTDTAAVTAAGALMDSEVVNLAAVKAFDPADYATAAQGALADSALQSVAEGDVTQHQAALSFTVSQVSDFDPANYAALAGATFTGDVTLNNAVNFSSNNLNTDHEAASTSKGLQVWMMTNAFTGDLPNYSHNTVLHFGLDQVRWAELAVPFGDNSSLFFRQHTDSSGVTDWKEIWNEATFNPDNYAARSGATFTGTVTIDNAEPTLKLTENDTTTAARLILSAGDLFIQSGAQGGGETSGAGDIRFSGYFANDIGEFQVLHSGAWRDIWHEGNLNPTNYAALSGATFTGDVTLSTNADTIFTVTAGDESNAIIDLGKTSDTDGARIAYDPDENLWFSTDSTERLRLKKNGDALFSGSVQTTGDLTVSNVNNDLARIESDSDRGRLRLYRAGATAYGQIIHDGTNFTLSTTAGVVKADGAAEVTGDLTVGNLVFDSTTAMGASEDNYVLTYDHAAGKIGLEAASGGLSFSTISSATTALSGSGYIADTTGGAFTVTLPATPVAGDRVVITDATGDWGTNNLTVGRNSSTIEGLAEDLVLNVSDLYVTLLYSGLTWQVYAEARSYDGTAPVTGVTAGIGLTGGGSSGAVTVDLDINTLTTEAVGTNMVSLSGYSIAGESRKVALSTLSLSQFNNDLTIPTASDAVYDEVAWNGDTNVPTKNAVRDAIENLDTGGVSGSTIYGLGMIL